MNKMKAINLQELGRKLAAKRAAEPPVHSLTFIWAGKPLVFKETGRLPKGTLHATMGKVELSLGQDIHKLWYACAETDAIVSDFGAASTDAYPDAQKALDALRAELIDVIADILTGLVRD